MMKNEKALLSEQQKIKLWAKIMPFTVVVLSIVAFKILAVASLALYLIVMLAFYKLIGKWNSPVVERLVYLLKMLGLGLGFIAIAVFIHAVVFMTT